MTALVRAGSGWHLDVEGRATLVLGGELHNSSAVGRQFLQHAVGRVVASGANTVLAPIAWEDVEPLEGHWDLSTVDDLVDVTHQAGLALIPLWFGAWKNGRSSYAPSWVLDDRARFPIAQGQVSHVPTLGLFDSELLTYERRAYLKVLERLAATGAPVVALQIDNEVGLLGDSRDRSPQAERAFAGSVPRALVNAINEASAACETTTAWTGDATSWTTGFGDSVETDALFMAWHYGRHVGELARSGRAVLDAPTFANAWLDVAGTVAGMPAGGDSPGEYPSGGPLPQVALAWRAAAPDLDMLCPDMYFGDSDLIMERFARGHAPFLIPETGADAAGAARAFLAIGKFGGVGIATFGIDQAGDNQLRAVRWAFERLAALTPWIIEARSERAVTGFILSEHVRETSWTREGVRYEVRLAQMLGWHEPQSAFGALIVGIDGQVVAVGSGFSVQGFDASSGEPLMVRDCEEGVVDDGEWTSVRRLNGDETSHGEVLILPPIEPDPRPGEWSLRSDTRTSGVRRARFVAGAVSRP